MRKMLSILLVFLLTVPTTVLAQQAPEQGRSATRPLLASALGEAARLGRSLDSASSATQAQPVPDPWEAISKLPLGSVVQVMLVDGAQNTGRLVEVRADALVLEQIRVRPGQKLARETFPRARVASATQRRARATGAQSDAAGGSNSWGARHPVLMGVVIGAGAGAALGAASFSDSKPHNPDVTRGTVALIGFSWGSGLGALGGWIVSRVRR